MCHIWCSEGTLPSPALLAFVRGGPGTWQKAQKTLEGAPQAGGRAGSQSAVPALGVTSREGAVHTRPGF